MKCGPMHQYKDDTQEAETVALSAVVLLPIVRSISDKWLNAHALFPKPYAYVGVGRHVCLPFTAVPDFNAS